MVRAYLMCACSILNTSAAHVNLCAVAELLPGWNPNNVVATKDALPQLVGNITHPIRHLLKATADDAVSPAASESPPSTEGPSLFDDLFQLEAPAPSAAEVADPVSHIALEMQYLACSLAPGSRWLHLNCYCILHPMQRVVHSW